MTAQITIKGLDELVSKIDRLAQMDAVKAALRNQAIHIAGEMAVYPPSTAANMPRTVAGTGTVLPWYERGWGTRYIGGGGVQSSEDLALKWKGAKPQIRDMGFTSAIGTNVKYAPFVQSDEKQARWMKDIGWKTDKQVLEDNRVRVTEYLADALDKIVNS